MYTVISYTGVVPATTDCRAETLRLTNTPYRTQVAPNQLVMVIARPINVNLSCKLHPYPLQKTRSPPGPRLPRRIGNTHPCNYDELKRKNIHVHFLFFFFKSRILLWIELKKNERKCTSEPFWYDIYDIKQKVLLLLKLHLRNLLFLFPLLECYNYDISVAWISSLLLIWYLV